MDRADDLASRLYSQFAYGILRMAVPSIPEGGFDFVLIDKLLPRPRRID